MLDAIVAWDEQLFRLVNGEWQRPLFDVIMPLVSDWKRFTIPFVVAGTVLIALGRLRGLRFVVLALVSVMVADALSTYVFKHPIGRLRPCSALEDVRILVGCTASGSFPSNHAVNASALATLVALHARPLRLPAALVAMTVAYSRVYIGAHYPLDVLAGAVLGIAVALILSRLSHALWRSMTLEDRQASGSRRRLFSLTLDDR
jgi:undecaprenyl-diphosphatase